MSGSLDIGALSQSGCALNSAAAPCPTLSRISAVCHARPAPPQSSTADSHPRRATTFTLGDTWPGYKIKTGDVWTVTTHPTYRPGGFGRDPPTSATRHHPSSTPSSSLSNQRRPAGATYHSLTGTVCATSSVPQRPSSTIPSEDMSFQNMNFPAWRQYANPVSATSYRQQRLGSADQSNPWRTCLTCNGWAFLNVKCQECEGWGLVDCGYRCLQCDGAGWTHQIRCFTCRGRRGWPISFL
jgi:hypothetical protein